MKKGAARDLIPSGSYLLCFYLYFVTFTFLLTNYFDIHFLICLY
jgi:hypothetical protein